MTNGDVILYMIAEAPKIEENEISILSQSVNIENIIDQEVKLDSFFKYLEC